MRVLLVNKFFTLRGGSEAVFFDTARLLQSHGHRVSFFSMQHPDNRPSPDARDFVTRLDFEAPGSFAERLKIPGRMVYSLEARNKLAAALDRERPDIVHCHNIHHQISPSILPLLRRRRIPIVMTLHDYKLVCPVYTLFRRGTVCEDCGGGRFFRCLTSRCCKDSAAKSFLSALEMSVHHRLLHIYGLVDTFISPSRFLAAKVRELGFRGRIAVLPNFLDAAAGRPSTAGSERPIVYFGRLSQEKGLATLLDAVKGLSLSLKIYGDGPLRPRLLEKIEREGLTNVSLAGHLPQEKLREELRQSMFVVCPSEWYENQPRAVLESFALGKPVVASRIGGLPELVAEGETGLLFEPGNARDLREKILNLSSDFEKIAVMGEKARALVVGRFGPEKHYQGLMEIYDKALSRREK